MNQSVLTKSLCHVRQFHRDERGSVAIEFMLFLPLIFAFFLSTFEIGMLMIRQTMVDRGVDITVRLIRLNQMVDANGDQAVTQDNIRRSICFFSSGLVPNCDNRMRIEMVRVDPHDWQGLPAQADCIDLNNPAAPARATNVGADNDLMLLRVCALVQPFDFTNGLGRILTRQSGELYAIFSTAAFVVEPTQ